MLSNLDDVTPVSPPNYQLTQLQRLVIAPAQLQHPQISLTSEQRHYLNRVLRLQQGDRFIAMDGQGQAWLAKLIQEHSSTPVQAEILEPFTAQTELLSDVTLIAALPKGNGFDDVVRQSTELGVTCIVPVVSDRTLLKPSPQKLERWRRIAQEAAEQSERQQVPTILEPVPFAAYLRSSIEPAAEQYLCVARGTFPHLLDCLLSHQVAPTSPNRLTRFIRIAIGPEDGWTEPELKAAIAARYQSVSLGRRILRAVTAPVVALSLIAAALEHQEFPSSDP